MIDNNEDALVIRIPRRLLKDLINQPPMGKDAPHESRVVHGPAPSRSDNDERPWSEPQRRLLYRLAYRLGHRGAQARAYIERALELGEGETPSLRAASQLIDRLKGEDEGGNRGAA